LLKIKAGLKGKGWKKGGKRTEVRGSKGDVRRTVQSKGTNLKRGL